MKMCNECFFRDDCPHKDIFIKIIIEEYDNSPDNPYIQSCERFIERHKNKKRDIKLKLKRNYTCFKR